MRKGIAEPRLRDRIGWLPRSEKPPDPFCANTWAVWFVQQ
jgi:hypothetical protein